MYLSRLPLYCPTDVIIAIYDSEWNTNSCRETRHPNLGTVFWINKNGINGSDSKRENPDRAYYYVASSLG